MQRVHRVLVPLQASTTRCPSHYDNKRLFDTCKSPEDVRIADTRRRRSSLSPGVVREPRGPGVPLRGAFRGREGPPSIPENAVLNTDSTLVLCINPLLPLSLRICSLVSLCTGIDGFAGSCIWQPGAGQKCPSCLPHLPTQTHLQ